jgi:branched-chain amino acid transport system substrate-binding protein
MMVFKFHAIAGALFIGFVAQHVHAQEAVVRLGHVAPTSGGIAHLGKDNENGARLAVEELNAKGITIGGKKIKFELLAEDDAADPKQGTAAAQKLVDSKVVGVIGHLNSPNQPLRNQPALYASRLQNNLPRGGRRCSPWRNARQVRGQATQG